MTQAAVMELLGLKREQVIIHNHLLGGGFGRRLDTTARCGLCRLLATWTGPSK